jgi:hypothetical protein
VLDGNVLDGNVLARRKSAREWLRPAGTYRRQHYEQMDGQLRIDYARREECQHGGLITAGICLLIRWFAPIRDGVGRARAIARRRNNYQYFMWI